MDFYDRVNLKLKENNMNRKELAEKIGMTYNTLNALYKRRSARIKLDDINKIAKVLNTTTDYLANGFDYRSSDNIEKIYESLPSNMQNDLINYAKYLLSKVKENNK
ncbi:MAG: helix-turn-helix domain-containing protein [Acholeplasmataceae bacterium]